MRIIHFFLTCLLSFNLTAQESDQKAPLPTLSESEVLHFQMLVEGNNRFAFDFYQRSKEQSGNLYFSSYSIVTGLAMAAIGAKGEMARQFQHAFHYSPALLLFVGDLNASLQETSGSKNPTQVLLANALWVNKNISILPSFTQTLLRDFRLTLSPVDFVHHLSESVQKINQWVVQHTKGKIRQVIYPNDVDGHTEMILTTAAYLIGPWAHPFDSDLTKRLPFQITVQRNFLTEMMHTVSDYLMWKGEKWDVLVLPYEQGEQGAQLAMALLLPKKGIPLSELENHLTWDNWRQWKSQLQKQKVALTFPKFRIDKRLELETLLKSLGLNMMFNSEADFSGMTDQKGVYLQTVLHKTSLNIDEKGANMMSAQGKKAVAAIAKDETTYECIADRPFVFMIWDQKTDSILFMGRLAIP